MVLRGDDAQVKTSFGPFGDSVILDAGYKHCLCQMHHRLGNHLDSVRLETVLVLVQDRCMVCAKRTIGLGIILDAPDGTHR
jgi:hypothetical protein